LPKFKTKRGAAKRFHYTGAGKIVRRRSHARHLLSKKTTKRKRSLRKRDLVSPADAGRVRRMIS